MKRRRISNPYPNPNPNTSPIFDTHSQLTGIVNRPTAEQSSSSLPPDHDDQFDVTLEINDDSYVNRTAETTMAAATTGLLVVSERNGSVVDGPPTDDCCPICFGDFVAPCRAPCGHWYCGGCILEYWSYVATFQPCKCPMCSRQITKLIPEPSLYQQENVEVGAVLKNVQWYNRLFVGGMFGFLLKMLQFPLFMKKVLRPMMDPDRALDNLGRLRWFTMLLICLYKLSPLDDFLPIEPQKVISYFNYSSLAIACILKLIDMYLQRRRRIQNVRRLADVI